MNSVHEAEVRKESQRKKLRQVETETQSPELVEEFEAKREIGGAKLRRVSMVSISGAHENCFLEGVRQ